jgi:Ca2+-binding EF-hand superfamily protein
LEFKEFLDGCSALFLSRKDKRAKLEYVFGLFDSNIDGYLSYAEIKEGFKVIFVLLESEGNIDWLSDTMANETIEKMVIKGSKIKKSIFSSPKLSIFFQLISN